jgi:predicted RNase H-like HicB family nuclease
MKHVKIIIEKHADGYVAYPVGVKGVVVGEGDSYEEALRDVQSALKFHIETFGIDVLDVEEGPILEAFIAETTESSAGAWLRVGARTRAYRHAAREYRRQCHPADAT